MEGDNVIWWMIGICIALTICLIFSKQLKIIFKILINSIFGIAGLLITNLLLSNIGVTVGINIITVLITAILGIPGLISLYLLQIIL